MAVGQVIPGLFFTFAAMVLLIFASVSSPTWDSIFFMTATSGSRTVHFGAFGFTGSDTHIGYTFDQFGFNNSRLDSATIHNLTKTLILHPIAAGIAGLATLFGLCGASYHRAGTVFMSLLAGLAMLASLLAWVLDMALFGIARSQFRNEGWTAQYGNATWLTLGATVSLLLGFCLGACGVFGHYRRRRSEAY
ncbi:pali-domain-containing protein [Dentipellis sp. KUC8613]|nr:pali-domain-containing protein [Dentipellis sp. KUC8613]